MSPSIFSYFSSLSFSAFLIATFYKKSPFSHLFVKRCYQKLLVHQPIVVLPTALLRSCRNATEGSVSCMPYMPYKPYKTKDS